MPSAFEQKLTKLINEDGVDAYLNMPDFILSHTIVEFLEVLHGSLQDTARWSRSSFPRTESPLCTR
jgi:hypothetical protein